MTEAAGDDCRVDLILRILSQNLQKVLARLDSFVQSCRTTAQDFLDFQQQCWSYDYKWTSQVGNCSDFS